MPKINIQSAGLSQAGGINAQASAADFGAETSQAVTGLGATIATIGSKQMAKAKKLEKERISNEAITQIHSYRAAALANDATFKKNNPDADQKARETNFNTFVKEYQANNELNPVAQKAFDKNAVDLKSKVTLDAIKTDGIRSINKQVDSISQTGSTLINTVTTDPTTLSDAIKEMQGVLSNPMLDENKARDMFTEFKQDASEAYFSTKLDKEGANYNPKQALQELASGKFDKMLDPKDKERLVAKATTAAEKQNTLDVSIMLNDQFSDPKDRIKFIEKPENAKKLGLNIQQQNLLLNQAHNEVTRARADKAEAVSASLADGSKRLNDALATEDPAQIKAALEFYTSNENMPAETAIAIRNSVANMNVVTDVKSYFTAIDGIESGAIDSPDKIDSLSNISSSGTNSKATLHAMLKTKKDNAGSLNYLDGVMKLYDQAAKGNTKLQENKLYMKQALLQFIKDTKVDSYHPSVQDEYIRLKEEKSGSGLFNFSDTPFHDRAFGGKTGLDKFIEGQGKPDNVTPPPDAAVKSGQDLPVIRSLEEASKLAPGTEFLDENGDRHKRK